MILRRIFNNMVIASMAFGLTSFSFAQDSATFDSKQGTWRLYYQDPETEQWITKHYVARTAIEPRIKTHISWAGKEFAYRYKVSNGKRPSRQSASFASGEFHRSIRCRICHP
ncbi:hypothetical protein LP417_25960 [Polaromonas sp. P1-6]|nr:hypothetical protein LP417_25960 [Polaromonas sp. P1-6]